MDNILVESPPSGVTTNFENPETRAPVVIAFVVVCLVLNVADFPHAGLHKVPDHEIFWIG
jgi:hypothetical protein